MVKLLKWKQIDLKIPQNHPNPFKTLDLAKIGNQGLPKIGTTLVEMPQNQFGYGRFQTLFRKFSNCEKLYILVKFHCPSASHKSVKQSVRRGSIALPTQSATLKAATVRSEVSNCIFGTKKQNCVLSLKFKL